MAKTTKTILLVEDEAPLREVLRDNLQDEGFKVVEATNGAQGLTLANKVKPDLILLDILMPKMDGMTMMEKFRTTKAGSRVPIMLLTNVAADKKIIKSLIRYMPVYYFDKSSRTIGEIIMRVKARLDVGMEEDFSA